MSRHIVHVEARGLPTTRRAKRQRRILNALSARCAPLPATAGGAPDRPRRPVRSFAFSMRAAPHHALEYIEYLLDECDPHWRRYVRAWNVLVA